MALVHSYPSLLGIDDLLDCLASQQNEPSRQEILASAHTVDATAHTQNLYYFINHLKEQDYPVYKSFIKHAQFAVSTPDPGLAMAQSSTLQLPASAVG